MKGHVVHVKDRYQQYQHIIMFFKTWLLNNEKHTLVMEVIFLPQHLDLVIVIRVPGQPVVTPGELEPHDDGHHATGVQVHPGGGHPEVHSQGVTLRPVLGSVQVNKLLCTMKCPLTSWGMTFMSYRWKMFCLSSVIASSEALTLARLSRRSQHIPATDED